VYRRTPLTRRAALWYRRNRRAANIMAPILLGVALIATILGVFAYQRGQRVDELGAEVETEQGKTLAEQGKREEEEKKRKASEEKSVIFKGAAIESARLKYFQEYIADMRLMPAMWKDSRVDLIRERLRRFEGQADDPRGFEWYYWNRVVNGSGQQWQADDRVISLDWSADGNTLYAADLTGQLTAWDRASGKTKPIRGPGARTMSVLAAPGGDTLAALTWSDHKIEIMKDGNITQTFKPQNGLWRYNAMAFSPDSKRLYAGTMMARIPSFDLETGKPALDLVENKNNKYVPPGQGRYEFYGIHTGEILSLAVSPNGTLLASGGEDGRIGLWITGGVHLRWLKGHRGHVVALAFSADGTKLVSRSVPPTNQQALFAPSAAGEVIVWNLTDFGLGGATNIREIPLRVPAAHTVQTRDKARVPGGNYRVEFIDADRGVVVGDGNVVRICDHSTGEMKELRGHAAAIVSLRACAKTGLLATGDERGEVRIWNLAKAAEEEVVLRLESPARRMSSFHGGKLAILLDASEFYKRAILYTGPEFKPVVPQQDGGDQHGPVACSPSGKYAATLADSRKYGGVMIWETATGKLFRAIGLRGVGLAFRSDDELYVASGTILARIDVQTVEL
jgi:WD40 repeat protein